MANLPELEIIRRELEREAIGKKVKECWVSPAALVSRHGTITDFCAQFVGQRIEEVKRQGLAIILTLDNEKVIVMVPGTRSRITRKTASAKRGQYTRLVFSFTTGGSIHYSDKNVDGAWFFSTAEQVKDVREVDQRGIDLLGPEAVKWPNLATALTYRRTKLYSILVDPEFMIGIGEIYANEALFRSGLSPLRSSQSLSNQEVRRLQRSILEVLQDAIKDGGMNLLPADEEDDYMDPKDMKFLEIYERDGQLDRRSRVPIKKVEVEEGVFAYMSSSQS